MLRKLLTILGILILVFVVLGALLSRDYRVSRSVVVNAPPAKIHPLVDDLKRWEEWTPWRAKDPSIVTTFGPKTSGVGASQTWTGEDGEGRLTITKSDPEKGIEFDLVFVHDREMPGKGWITYAPVAGGTQVEWGLVGTMEMAVVGGYFARMADLMMGGMFEKGLHTLKTRAEGP
jgi:hypothetical protein